VQIARSRPGDDSGSWGHWLRLHITATFLLPGSGDLVMIHSMATAPTGVRRRWHKLTRTGVEVRQT
jgi:hypothetical protein